MARCPVEDGKGRGVGGVDVEAGGVGYDVGGEGGAEVEEVFCGWGGGGGFFWLSIHFGIMSGVVESL